MTEPEDLPQSTSRIARYHAYEAEDGSTVVYDGENDAAWVRSDTTVELRR